MGSKGAHNPVLGPAVPGDTQRPARPTQSHGKGRGAQQPESEGGLQTPFHESITEFNGLNPKLVFFPSTRSQRLIQPKKRPPPSKLGR